MKYRKLGKTGFEVSEIGYGGWGIGGGWGAMDDGNALKAIDRAMELGVNFFDTALGYGDGHSEKLIGKAVKKSRDKVFIATKIPPKTFNWPVLPHEPLETTFPAEWIIKCTEESLRNLDTDYIDVQQLHAWTAGYVEQTEWLEAFAQLKKQGKVRAFGVSANDWDPYNTVSLVKSGMIDSVQVIYNIFEQRPEEQLLPAALENGVGIIVRVPFEEGLLTGNLKPGHVFGSDDWRADWLTPERLREANERVEKLKAFLKEDRPDLPSLALKFCLSHPAVSAVIPGMSKVHHVEANCAVSDGILPDTGEISELKKHAFVHGWSYPWSQRIESI